MIMVTFGYLSCCAAAPHVTKQYFKKIYIYYGLKLVYIT